MRAQMGLSRSIVLHPALFIASKRKAVASLGGLFLRSGREHNKPVENSLARVHRLHLSLPMRQHLRVLSCSLRNVRSAVPLSWCVNTTGTNCSGSPIDAREG